MTRLTLEWHLRGIIEGTVEAFEVRRDIEWCDTLDRWDRTGKSYYADPYVEGNREQRSYSEASSYTTGFTQESGDFCDAYDRLLAMDALNSDDPVRYLDAVAHDPFRTAQERYEASELLDRHIWPDETRDTNMFADTRREDVDLSEWVDAGITRSGGATCFPMRCSTPGCMEGECLADPDIHREEGRAVCMNCGTEQPVPEYP